MKYNLFYWLSFVIVWVATFINIWVGYIFLKARRQWRKICADYIEAITETEKEKIKYRKLIAEIEEKEKSKKD